MIQIKDLNGDIEFLTNIKNLTRKRKVNGEKTITFFVIPDETNEHSFPMVDMESTVEFQGEKYVIKRVNEKNIGKRSVKQVTAIHKFFTDLIDSYQYNLHNGSMTFNNALNFVFQGTGYTHNIVDSFLAESFENFGDDNRLSLFKRVLDRYGAEFYVVGKQVYLKRELGSRTDFQYRYAYNVKTIEKTIDTSNLATIIRGFGGEPVNGVYPVEEELISPNIEVLGERHAPAVRDERITTKEGMLARLRRDLIDEPQISITIDFVDLRAAGYRFEVPNEGDYGFILYEPMGLDVEARILEIDEEFDYNLRPIKTNVTLSNIRENVIDTMTRFSQTSKTVNRIMAGQEKIPYNVLDGAVKIATEALKSAQTELEFENGIIARNKDNPNLLVLFNSAGIGISTDGGNTFTTAMTGNGIVADVITAGIMSFNRSRGGELILGGKGNNNGVMHVYNSDGEIIADLDGDRGGFSDLTIGNLTVTERLDAPGIVYHGTDNLEIYVTNTASASDDNTGLGGWSNALWSVQEAINRIPKFYDGNCTIILGASYEIVENIEFRGFTGGGSITFDLRGNTFKGYIRVVSCSLRVVVTTGKVDRRAGSVYLIDNEGSTYLTVDAMYLNGNGHEQAVRTWRGGQTYITNGTEAYNVRDCFRATSLSRIFVSGKGLGTRNGVRVEHGSIAHLGNTIPDGSTASTGSTDSSEIIGTVVVDRGAAGPAPVPPPPPVTETTQTWNASSAGQWSTGFNNWATTSYPNLPYQGQWNQWGLYTGCWFFGSNMRNTLQGKTIKRIRVRVRRFNGGGDGGSVNAIFRMHQHASRPSGAPTTSSTSQSVGFKRGERKWFTLPSSFHSLFSSGNWYGLAIHTTSTSNSNYMIFEAGCEIEVTYEG